MRYLIASDFHINDARLKDCENILHQIESRALLLKPDKYIIAGDVTHKRIPSKRVIRLVINHFYAMSRIVSNIIVELGNHDVLDNDNYSLDFLKETRRIYKLSVFKHPVVIDKYLYVDHCHISESKMGTTDYAFGTMSYKKLIKQYPYVKIFIVGHIHKPQLLSVKPLILIPGSTDRINFGERLEKKYIYLLNNFKLYKYELKIRPMYQIDFDLNEKKIMINGKSVSKIDASIIDDSIIKIIVRGYKEQIIRFNSRRILAKFKNAYSLNFGQDVLISESLLFSNKNKKMKEQSINKLFDEYLVNKKLDENTKDFCQTIFKTNIVNIK